MLPYLVHRYSDPPAFSIALHALGAGGLGPRSLLFLALDSAGVIHLALPLVESDATSLKVGDKLSLTWDEPGRFYHYDSIHRLAGGRVLYSGDRRLPHAGDADDTAGAVCELLRDTSTRSVFFGCTPHAPGSWIAGVSESIALHDLGFVEAVPCGERLLARRVDDDRLWSLVLDTHGLEDWEPVWRSPLGKVLMLERRLVRDRLVVSCEGGLVEVEVNVRVGEGQPLGVVERGRIDDAPLGVGVVGRAEGGSFAVTRGQVEEWGLVDLQPAVLMGAGGAGIEALRGRL